MSDVPLPRAFVHEVTARCDLHCAHCYCPWTAAGAAEPRELRVSGIEIVADRLAALPARVEALTLTGGEPLLRDDLADIVAIYRRRLPRAQIAVATNGQHLDDGAAKALRRAGVSSAQLTLLGPSPELHDRLVGKKGAFDRTLRAVANAKACRLDVAVFFVAMRENAEQFLATACLALAVGADAIVFNRVQPGGRGLRGFAGRSPTPEQLRACLRDATASELTVRMGLGTAIPPLEALAHRSIARWNGCPIGTRDAYPTIGPDGLVRPCNHSPRAAGSLLAAPLREIIRAAPMRAGTVPEECRGCEHEAGCRGGCPAARELAGAPIYACQKERCARAARTPA